VKCAIEMDSGGMIYTEHFMKIGIGIEALLRSCLSKLKGCNVGITDDRDV
jgi:hypothetical protein